MLNFPKWGRKKKREKKLTKRGQKRTFFIFIHIIKHCCFFNHLFLYDGGAGFVFRRLQFLSFFFFYFCFLVFLNVLFWLLIGYSFYPHFLFLWVISFHCNRYFFFNTSWHGKESHQRFFFSKRVFFFTSLSCQKKEETF